MGPVVAPEGTVALILEYDLIEKEAATPLNVTDVAPRNALPVIVTAVSTGPLVGVKPEILGLTRNEVVLWAVPCDVVTKIGPLVAPMGTFARI